jgi:hypothetical protein
MTLKQSLLCSLILLAPAAAPAFEFKPAARFNVAGSYSSIPPTSSWGANGDLFLLPAMKQGDWSLIPLFAAIGKTSEKAVLEDTFFVESYTFLAKPQLRWQRGTSTYRVFGGAKRAINKETTTEVWSAGRYDYEEYGVGLGGAWKPWDFLGEVKASLEDLHRTYMNYHELGTAVVGGKNYYSKDYDGWKFVVGTEAKKDSALLWTFDYTLLLKNYTDSYLETKDKKPDLDAGLRRDQLHRFDGGLQGPLGHQMAWGVDLGFDLNLSNQGYLDPTTFVFDQDFYGYFSETLGGSLTWFPRGPEGPSLTPAYSLTLRNYTGRSIRNPSGEFTAGKQADTEHTVSLNGRWPLLKWAALTGGMDYYSVQSNQAFVLRIKNTFDVFRAKLGVDLKY